MLCFYINPAKLPAILPKTNALSPRTRNLNSMGPKALWGAGIGSAPGTPLSESGGTLMNDLNLYMAIDRYRDMDIQI